VFSAALAAAVQSDAAAKADTGIGFRIRCAASIPVWSAARWLFDRCMRCAVPRDTARLTLTATSLIFPSIA
jgi:hypothetical protein